MVEQPLVFQVGGWVLSQSPHIIKLSRQESQYGRVAMLAPPTSVEMGSNPGLACGLRFVDLILNPRVFLLVLQFSSLSKINSQLIPPNCDAVLVVHAQTYQDTHLEHVHETCLNTFSHAHTHASDLLICVTLLLLLFPDA